MHLDTWNIRHGSCRILSLYKTRVSAVFVSLSSSKNEHDFGSVRGRFVFAAPGAIAQLGERVLCKHEVVGSIPSGSTTLHGLPAVASCGARVARDGPVAQVVRAHA